MPDVEGEITQRGASEAEADDRLRALVLARMSGGTFGVHWSHPQTLFLKRQALSRLLYYDDLYRRMVDVPGVICEFVQWGASNRYERHIIEKPRKTASRGTFRDGYERHPGDPYGRDQTI